MGEERSVRKPGWNAGSDCLEVSLCLLELLQCRSEFFVKHLKFVLAGTGGVWLMAVGAWAALSGSTNTHSSESSWARMLQMTFLSKMFAAGKKNKKSHHLSFLLWGWKHWWSFALFFFLHLSWGKGGNGGDGKLRGYTWDYEKFGFTKGSCLNCSLANCMDKI